MLLLLLLWLLLLDGESDGDVVEEDGIILSIEGVHCEWVGVVSMVDHFMAEVLLVAAGDDAMFVDCVGCKLRVE